MFLALANNVCLYVVVGACKCPLEWDWKVVQVVSVGSEPLQWGD